MLLTAATLQSARRIARKAGQNVYVYRGEFGMAMDIGGQMPLVPYCHLITPAGDVRTWRARVDDQDQGRK